MQVLRESGAASKNTFRVSRRKENAYLEHFCVFLNVALLFGAGCKTGDNEDFLV